MLNIKVIDFGLASRLHDLDTDIKNLSTLAGTPQFQAPEIFEKETYDGLKADMFSIGVILFMIVIKSYPFKTSDIKDKFYRLIIQNT
jgi:serine/threonine protein kinase